ncbi:MAG: hypothetical protein LC797_04470 [Chloroflexi bacterium]|nr:hypothetical protein [Chloroflexota bacterium]
MDVSTLRGFSGPGVGVRTGPTGTAGATGAAGAAGPVGFGFGALQDHGAAQAEQIAAAGH